MRRTIAFGLPIFALLMGGTALAAARSWRPVMPDVVVDVRTADNDQNAPSLMIIYGENGSDPFLEGVLGAERRISACKTVGSLCVSKAARNELGSTRARRQSLQIRLANGKGNPVVGGVEWVGAAHPQQVRVICDLRIKDARKSCSLSDVTA
ncbi:hypothetical protein K9B35_08575 [Sphingomonas sp. R647]|uniref:hypothetical protein n=1 Tax=Sphingomonas sp. R647 TaxID=2875233 RepID=UPI001CD38E44|nr:hypothetical protein [Sphingomonas sp. R647]MCA1198019.1 hypothetical protein [Sphingomonas sp. R647]